MNKRIQELAEQCREEYPDTEWPNAVRYRFDEAKFAELIVRECMGVVEDAVNHREPASTYVGKIREHFGVEE